MIILDIKDTYETTSEALDALSAERDRISLLDFDPARVPGSLLIDFNLNAWPVGWCWEDEPAWLEDYETPYGGLSPLSSDKVYDIRVFVLVDDDNNPKRLEDFVRDFVRNQSDGAAAG